MAKRQMRPLLVVICGFILPLSLQAESIKTPAEMTNFTQYSQHEEISRFLSQVDHLSKEMIVQIIGKTKEMVYDFVDRGRAVEVFINMTPAASMYSLRQGHRDLGLTECNQILIAEQLGDYKPLVLTWNNTSLYTWGFLDLKKDGPTVIELPPDVLGILDDMYFR